MQDAGNNNPIDRKISSSETKESETVIPGTHSIASQPEKKQQADVKETIEEEVKESFQDEDVPVEPAVGNDGLEVGGEG